MSGVTEELISPERGRTLVRGRAKATGWCSLPSFVKRSGGEMNVEDEALGEFSPSREGSKEGAAPTVVPSEATSLKLIIFSPRGLS